ncbi:hypothetical protein GCM10027342_18580 [Photobacterium alginatilyticum]
MLTNTQHVATIRYLLLRAYVTTEVNVNSPGTEEPEFNRNILNAHKFFGCHLNEKMDTTP